VAAEFGWAEREAQFALAAAWRMVEAIVVAWPMAAAIAVA
jgi:hypothetical protein